MKVFDLAIVMVRNIFVLAFVAFFGFLTFAYFAPASAVEAAKVVYSPQPIVPNYMNGGITTDTQGSVEKIIKTKNVKTCGELIRVWKPAHLADGVKVECNNAALDKVSKSAAGLTMVQGFQDNHFGGYMKIYLREDASMDTLVDAYNHEAFHTVSYSWSEAKQGEFIKFMGGTSWREGSYKDRIGERWAWAATSCNGAKLKAFQGYENKVPGGCKAINQWLK